MAATGTGCSKQNGRRNREHAGYYASLPPRVLKRKERNVRRSSHGKHTRESLMAHHAKVSGIRRPAPKQRPIKPPADAWITYQADFIPEANRAY